MDPGGYVNCDCSNCKGMESDSNHKQTNIKKKRHIFPEILLEYLRENNFEKFGVKWCKHQSQNPSATLDCVQVDWDILLGVHKTVKNRQNLVKSFTNWKFIRVVEAPVEIWFCNQLDSSKERSLFRPDNPQVTKLVKVTNENGTPLNPQFDFPSLQKKGSAKVNEVVPDSNQICLKDFVTPLITSKLNGIELTIWQQCVTLTQAESYLEVPIDVFKLCVASVSNSLYFDFPESDTYLFLGSRDAKGEQVVTIYALSKFVRNFGPWEIMYSTMQAFVNDGAYNWYHGTTTDMDVRALLRREPGNFLVRNRMEDDASFSLEYVDYKGELMSVVIFYEQNQYKVLISRDQVVAYPCLSQFIASYKHLFRNPISKQCGVIDRMDEMTYSTPSTPALPTTPIMFSPYMQLGFSLKVKTVNDLFFNEIRFETQPLTLNVLVDEVKRKLRIPPQTFVQIIKDNNILVDDENVSSLQFQQELLVVLR